MSSQIYFQTLMATANLSHIVHRESKVESTHALRHVTPSQLLPLLRRSSAFHQRTDQLYCVFETPFSSIEDSIGDVTTDQHAHTLVTTNHDDVIQAISFSAALELAYGKVRLVFSFYPLKDVSTSAMLEMMTSHLQRHLVMFIRSSRTKHVVVSVLLASCSYLEEGQITNKLEQLFKLRPTVLNSSIIPYVLDS